MSRVVFASISFLLGLSSLAAQQTPPPAPAPSKEERAAAAAVQAPMLPPPVVAPPAPGTFIAPPLPGQLKAEPAAPAKPASAETPPAAKTAPAPAAPQPPKSPEAAALPPKSGPAPAKDQGLKPVAPTALNKSKAPANSTSSSGQFIVHGEELSLRSAFSGKCEEISTELRQLLRDQEPWVLPVVVLLKTGEAAKAGPAVSYSVSQIPNSGFHLQVTVNVRGDMRPEDLRSNVIRVLLAERILRNQKELAKKSTLLPDWVFTGALEAMDYRQRARPSALFGAIFKSGKIYSIEEIIEASPVSMDALSKTIYQTSCCALILALLDQPEGNLRFGKFLNALASDPRTERELMNQWFPNFATTPTSLNKWWSLQLAALANPTIAEPLTPTETMKQLEAALTFHYKAKPSEIPKPHPVVAELSRAAAEEAAKPKAKEEPVADKDESNKKPSFFQRLNPFGKKTPTDEQVIANATKEAALAEAKVTEAPPAETKVPTKTADATPAADAEAHPAKKPFMSWLFGSDDKKKPTDDKEAAETKQKLADEKKAAEAKKAAEDKEAKKLADERKATEAKRIAEEKKLADEKAAEDKKLAAEAKQKLADEKKTADAKQKAADEKKAVEAKQKAAEEKKAADAKQKLADAKKADAKKEEPKAKSRGEEPKKAEAASEESSEKKPSNLNPLHWFRGGKKEPAKDADKEEAPAKKGAQNSLSSTAAQMLWAWSPLAADSLAFVQGERPASVASRQVEGFLGMKFGKKKDADGEEAPKDKNEKRSEPKADKKPEKKEPEKKETKKEEAKPEPKADKKPAKKEPEKEEAKVEEKKPEPKAEKKKEAPKEPEPKEAPAPAATTKPDEAKPESSRLKSLFGFGKKDDADKAPASEKEKTKEAPAPAEKEKAKTKITESKDKAAKKGAPDEPLVDAVIVIEDYAAIMKRKDKDEILKRTRNSLAALQTRASVLFRPIIAEYGEILRGLSEGKTKGVDERLHTLRVRAAATLSKAKAVRDFVDVYEANESPSFSGLFDDYLKLPETITNELPDRTDAMSKYLDALDKEFSGH